MSSCWNQYKNTKRYIPLILLTILFYFSEFIQGEVGDPGGPGETGPKGTRGKTVSFSGCKALQPQLLWEGLFCLFIYLFYYFGLCWVFIAVHGLSLVAASGVYSLLRCAGFSLWWLLLLQSTGSRRVGFSSCGTQALERRLSSCGARAQLLRSMWDLPGPGLEPVCPALAGRLLTTAPPGNSFFMLLQSFELSFGPKDL